MINSFDIHQRAEQLVRQCETRDTVVIAKEIGVKIYRQDPLGNLLGMYTFMLNHRIIFVNPKLNSYWRQMVVGHELGHDTVHREQAKAGAMQEFTLYRMGYDATEYEANAFLAHLKLDSDRVYRFARSGYDVGQIANATGMDINIVLIKLQEMNKLGYDLRVPIEPDSRFFRKVKGSRLRDDDWDC